MLHKICILFILCTAVAVPMSATPEIEAEIVRSTIKIGDQTEIRLKASTNGSTSVEFPTYDSLQTLSPGIEVLYQKDSSSTSGRTQIRTYTITSFDTAVHQIPSIKVKVDGKDYMTKELPLRVLSVPIDTTNVEQIYDLKGAMEPSFDISEWYFPFILSIITLIVSLLITYIIIRIKDNKPIIRRIRLTPYIPPHKAAMNEISKIKDDALWESDDSKTYYTKLTDILRRYMQGRYGFNAMEMTTDEIISEIEKVNDPSAIQELGDLFTTADLVKFAKAHPAITDNDKNLLNAINYIQSTKKEEVVETSSQEVVVVDIRSKRSKRLLYTCITIAFIAMVIATSYLIKQISILNY